MGKAVKKLYLRFHLKICGRVISLRQIFSPFNGVGTVPITKAKNWVLLEAF